MRAMAAIHIRNVPEQLIAALKRHAKRNGRSLNAEVVEALKEHDERERRTADLRRQLEEIRREWRIPSDLPTPEEMIRAGREERDRRIAGDL